MDTTDFAEKLRSYRNNGNCEICGHPATRWMYDDYLRVDNPQHASQIAYTMQSAADAFSLDVDTRDRIRLALEHRAARIEKRRKKAAKVKPADKPIPKPML